MRLINTVTGTLEEFHGSNTPRYAILSHTWEDDEVTFQDMCRGSHLGRRGYVKITMTCRKALESGLEYAWVDTCCIDKTSSAELSEAINSMFRWYRRASICYAFLSDFAPSGPIESELGLSRWFTRGWTLQELIAPKEVIFFDQDWNVRGVKTGLVEHLATITGINGGILSQKQDLSSIPVARRMSWPAKRKTTRLEDEAYCLLGIFDVNMPLLYGEEEKAFRRLQHEIIASTPDLSIFAWCLPSGPHAPTTRSAPRTYCGILADSPAAFLECVDLLKVPHHTWRDVSVCSIGIKTNIQILREIIPATQGTRYILPVDCIRNERQGLLGVRLRKVGPHEYVRENPWALLDSACKLYSMVVMPRYLLTALPSEYIDGSASRPRISREVLFQKRNHVLQMSAPTGFNILDTWPSGIFDGEDQIFFLSAGLVNRDVCAIKFGLNVKAGGSQRHKPSEFDFMFFAVGWASLDLSDLQCTVVDWDKYVDQLTAVESTIREWHETSKEVVETLQYYEIPKSPTVVFKSSPKTTRSVVVSFEPVMVCDETVCRRPFWRIKFSFEIMEGKRAPTPSRGRWTSE